MIQIVYVVLYGLGRDILGVQVIAQGRDDIGIHLSFVPEFVSCSEKNALEFINVVNKMSINLMIRREIIRRGGVGIIVVAVL